MVLDPIASVCIFMPSDQTKNYEFNSRKLLRMLEKDGRAIVRVRGDHHTLKKKGVQHPIVLVHPKKDLPIGLVRKIYKDAGWR